MPSLTPILPILNPLGSLREQPARETWLERIGIAALVALGSLGIFYPWARFAFLCAFPTIVPFCHYLLIDAPKLKESLKPRVVKEFFLVHAIMLFGIFGLCVLFPSVIKTNTWYLPIGVAIPYLETYILALRVRSQARKVGTEAG